MSNKYITINNKTCTLLNVSTQKAQHYLIAFKSWAYGDIYQAYEKPSYYKVKAWNKIDQDAIKNGSYDCVVIGKNSSYFTTAHTEYNKVDNITYLIIDTYCNRYAIIYKSGK